ncbi:hypothetical protein [Flectobacillus longus]|uniref:hypothetical protein n=1 Tax=Flectobacillus longus TaxID=2984207 RepID=UPI0024B68AE1|nr:hypothetical protein [Flectobacillus longus]MDI9878063.1 hypothetical protein [Flectobacillus longus]
MKLDFKQIENELSKIKEIDKRLDYWYGLMDENVFQKVRDKFGEYNGVTPTKRSAFGMQKELIKAIGLFEYSKDVLTSIFIPLKLYDSFFKEFESNPKYTSWYLKHNSKRLLNFFCTTERILDFIEYKDVSSLKLALKELEEYDNLVKQRLSKFPKIIHIKEGDYDYQKYLAIYFQYQNEVEYARLKQGFYDKNPIKSVHTPDNTTEFIYAKYFLFKGFINESIKMLEQDGNDNEIQTQINDEPQRDEEIRTQVNDEPQREIVEKKELTPRINILSDIIPELTASLSNNIIRGQDMLEELLRGNPITGKLLFYGNQNLLIELFLRLHYNSKITNNKTEIMNWLVHNFEYEKKQIVKRINESTALDILNRGRGIPNRGKIICPSQNYPYQNEDMRRKNK